MKRLITSAVAVLALGLGVTAEATAADDITGPALRLPPYASFVTGSTISTVSPSDYSTESISMRATWSASDPSGVCGYRYYDRDRDPEGGQWSAWAGTKQVTVSTSDYDGWAGGGSDVLEGYDVQARDCLGNITQRFVRFRPSVVQENGQSAIYGEWTEGKVSYSGTWGTSFCACWSGGTTRKTRAYGAKVTFTFSMPDARKYPVGLVMERAPGRGKAQVYVDGVLRKTIDTYAATATHRSVVWAGNVTGGGTGTHTLTIKNLATPGRPRIDVDAVLLSPDCLAAPSSTC